MEGINNQIDSSKLNIPRVESEVDRSEKPKDLDDAALKKIQEDIKSVQDFSALGKILENAEAGLNGKMGDNLDELGRDIGEREGVFSSSERFPEALRNVLGDAVERIHKNENIKQLEKTFEFEKQKMAEARSKGDLDTMKQVAQSMGKIKENISKAKQESEELNEKKACQEDSIKTHESDTNVVIQNEDKNRVDKEEIPDTQPLSNKQQSTTVGRTSEYHRSFELPQNNNESESEKQKRFLEQVRDDGIFEEDSKDSDAEREMVEMETMNELFNSQDFVEFLDGKTDGGAVEVIQLFWEERFGTRFDKKAIKDIQSVFLNMTNEESNQYNPESAREFYGVFTDYKASEDKIHTSEEKIRELTNGKVLNQEQIRTARHEIRQRQLEDQRYAAKYLKQGFGFLGLQSWFQHTFGRDTVIIDERIKRLERAGVTRSTLPFANAKKRFLQQRKDLERDVTQYKEARRYAVDVERIQEDIVSLRNDAEERCEEAFGLSEIIRRQMRRELADIFKTAEAKNATVEDFVVAKEKFDTTEDVVLDDSERAEYQERLTKQIGELVAQNLTKRFAQKTPVLVKKLEGILAQELRVASQDESMKKQVIKTLETIKENRNRNGLSTSQRVAVVLLLKKLQAGYYKHD